MAIYTTPTTTARLYCPVNFDPYRVLPEKEHKYADDLIYLCHAVIMGNVRDPRYRKGKDGGFVPLKAVYMRNILGRRRWSHVRPLAVACGLLDCNES